MSEGAGTWAGAESRRLYGVAKDGEHLGAFDVVQTCIYRKPFPNFVVEDIMAKLDELPSKAGKVAKAYPKVWEAFSALGENCAKAGPLDPATVRLVKLALAIGASSEGAVHSHVRRAIAEGVNPKQLEHVAILAIPTVGFPQAVRAMTWIEDITE